MQSVHNTTNVVSSNPTHVGCTRYYIMWQSWADTCRMSVVFYGYSVSCTNKTDHNAKHHNLNPNPIINQPLCWIVLVKDHFKSSK
jgi:hypothetical protein